MSNYNKFARHQLTKLSHLPQCYNTPDTAILHKTSLPEFYIYTLDYHNYILQILSVYIPMHWLTINLHYVSLSSFTHTQPYHNLTLHELIATLYYPSLRQFYITSAYHRSYIKLTFHNFTCRQLTTTLQQVILYIILYYISLSRFYLARAYHNFTSTYHSFLNNLCWDQRHCAGH